MARGKAIGRFEAALGVVGLLALVVSYSVITGWNPLPKITSWLDKARTMSDPPPTWKVSVDDEPRAAGGTFAVVLVSTPTGVTGYRTSSGDQVWTQAAKWSGMGGSYVALGHQNGKGYDVVAASDGVRRWDNASAIGVWTFSNLLIDLACPDALSCTLTARNPDNGAVRWQSGLVGNGRALGGANKPLSGVRPMTDLDPTPGPVPPLLGFSIDDQLQVISSASGRRLHTYTSNQTTRVIVDGDRALVSTAASRGSSCRFTLTARDPDGDRQTWRRDGYDLRTAESLGCDQRRDPQGGGGAITAIGIDGRDVVLDAASGDELYEAPDQDSIAATDGRTALVRSADKQTVRAVDLANGQVLWERKVGKRVAVGFGPDVVTFTDPDTNRLTVVVEQSGTPRLDVDTLGQILGYTDVGVMINVGRTVALLTYGSVVSPTGR